MRRKKGFTLIELMIVVAIIAILASILIPSFLKARAQAQLSGCEANLKNMATALEMYNTDYAVYPSQTSLYGAPFQTDYMRAVPNCPIGLKSYYYTSDSANGANFTANCTDARGHARTIVSSVGLPQYSPIGGLITK
jgi:type II secretion system protein G